MPRKPAAQAALVASALAAALAGCGGDSGEEPRSGRSDPPVRPPAGWRVVANEAAGFTVAAPRRWTARTRGRATLIRSPDRLVALTVAADRSRAGRELPPARYARTTLERLPGFEGSVSTSARRVPGTPYRTARVDGLGAVRTSRTAQRITVAAYRVAGEGTFAAVVFRNARVTPPRDDRVVERLLRTLRAGAPAG